MTMCLSYFIRLLLALSHGLALLVIGDFIRVSL